MNNQNSILLLIQAANGPLPPLEQVNCCLVQTLVYTGPIRGISIKVSQVE